MLFGIIFVDTHQYFIGVEQKIIKKYLIVDRLKYIDCSPLPLLYLDETKQHNIGTGTQSVTLVFKVNDICPTIGLRYFCRNVSHNDALLCTLYFFRSRFWIWTAFSWPGAGFMSFWHYPSFNQSPCIISHFGIQQRLKMKIRWRTRVRRFVVWWLTVALKFSRCLQLKAKCTYVTSIWMQILCSFSCQWLILFQCINQLDHVTFLNHGKM